MQYFNLVKTLAKKSMGIMLLLILIVLFFDDSILDENHSI